MLPHWCGFLSQNTYKSRQLGGMPLIPFISILGLWLYPAKFLCIEKVGWRKVSLWVLTHWKGAPRQLRKLQGTFCERVSFTWQEMNILAHHRNPHHCAEMLPWVSVCPGGTQNMKIPWSLKKSPWSSSWKYFIYLVTSLVSWFPDSQYIRKSFKRQKCFTTCIISLLGAVVTKSHTQGGLNNGNVLPYSSRG